MIVKALPMLRNMLLLIQQSVLKTPIPILAGSGTAELGLHSIHSYGYVSHCSLGSSAPMLVYDGPSIGILVRNPG